jgi:glutamate synthase domain-containing protein 2
MTNQLCEKFAAKGAHVPDIGIAGRFSSKDHVFQVLAMGAPHTKAVCMGRAMMIPGMVGKNIGLWMRGSRSALSGYTPLWPS